MTDQLTPEQDAALSAVMPEVVKAIASAVSSGTWKPKPIAEAVLSVASRTPAPEVPHVPTPDELEDLMVEISLTGYASEAVEVVEEWTRKWWGVESTTTTKFAEDEGRP